MTQSEFIKFITPYAVEAAKGTKIYPAVIIARAVIEGGNSKGQYYTSPLLTQANNFFGITAGPKYSGNKELFKTWEGVKVNTYGNEEYLGQDGKRYIYRRYFRKYASPADSFRDFITLVSNGRYKESVKAATPGEQAAIISRAGYATAPGAEKIFVQVTNKVNGAIAKVVDLVKENKAVAGGGVGVLLLAGALYFIYGRK